MRSEIVADVRKFFPPMNSSITKIDQNGTYFLKPVGNPTLDAHIKQFNLWAEIICIGFIQPNYWRIDISFRSKF